MCVAPCPFPVSCSCDCLHHPDVFNLCSIMPCLCAAGSPCQRVRSVFLGLVSVLFCSNLFLCLSQVFAFTICFLHFEFVYLSFLRASPRSNTNCKYPLSIKHFSCPTYPVLTSAFIHALAPVNYKTPQCEENHPKVKQHRYGI